MTLCIFPSSYKSLKRTLKLARRCFQQCSRNKSTHIKQFSQQTIILMKHHINQCILLNPKGWLSELTVVVPTEKKDTFLDQIINEEIENVMFKSQSFVHAVLMSTLHHCHLRALRDTGHRDSPSLLTHLKIWGFDESRFSSVTFRESHESDRNYQAPVCSSTQGRDTGYSQPREEADRQSPGVASNMSIPATPSWAWMPYFLDTVSQGSSRRPWRLACPQSLSHTVHGVSYPQLFLRPGVYCRKPNSANTVKHSLSPQASHFKSLESTAQQVRASAWTHKAFLTSVQLLVTADVSVTEK